MVIWDDLVVSNTEEGFFRKSLIQSSFVKKKKLKFNSYIISWGKLLN